MTRAEIGLDDGVPAFWCGQSFFKFLPQFDSLYAKIALATGPCKFVFVQHTKRIYATEVFQAAASAGVRGGRLGRRRLLRFPS